ncbi:hypothetical protein CXF68_07465 [Tenacibaculum sp. Bg11-29]|uniref:hypothetical protein n=1 Tax=Tenacibaculum sp. Bg11-29 TaxID=2058306 RepID=UPI000C34FB27|nr:hypothetical protein [Tenacibaculum sp. Bg11-29]PKH50544.1 hypothetical protein CXF68_07465 [Tenacibaculum sp. Bg11-29]
MILEVETRLSSEKNKVAYEKYVGKTFVLSFIREESVYKEQEILVDVSTSITHIFSEFSDGESNRIFWTKVFNF